MSPLRHHTLADGRRLAYRHGAGAGPMLVFLPGYLSDMAGGKAGALFAWAQARAQACLLLDYSGCGESDGDFAQATLGAWVEECWALIDAVERGPVVLVGSSMGGWLMLLMARARPERVAALIGIAAAPDFTEWGYSDADKARLAAGETVLQASAYGYDPTPTHAAFWADGQANRVLGGELAIACPVRLLHGQADPDVPWQTSLQLAAALRSDAVQVTLVKDGDHRLSRDEDIALLLRIVGDVLEIVR